MKLLCIVAVLGLNILAGAIPQLQPDTFAYKWNTQPSRFARRNVDATRSSWEASGRLSKRVTPVNAALPSSSNDPGAVTGLNPYTAAPYTGVIRSYDFTISRKTLSPDGTAKDMIVVNGQFPGPTITANWGDTIQVRVTNDLDEGTAIHWHGFLQSITQWSDGVPGISECPITPGRTRTYTFQAQLYGTSWYHSHYSAQYANGAVGPIVINGPSQLPYDADLGPVMLQDLYYPDYFQIVEDIMGTDISKVRPASDNNLINGIGCPPTQNSTAEAPSTLCTNLDSFKVQKGKKYRMRIINSSAAAIQKFSIDGHNLTVIAYDFVAIQPITQQIITLGVAQRADVIVEATGDSNSAYWMRANMSQGDCTEPAAATQAWAILQYEDVADNVLPDSAAHVDTTSPCENDPLESTQPMFGITPGAPDIVESYDIGFEINSTGHFLWLLDDQTFRTNYNHPPLLLAKNGNTSYPLDPQWNIHEANSSGSIRVNLTNTTPTSHPMHLHGHNMYVLASGVGAWDGTITNPDNPMRRDVQIVPANGYLVVQWDLDNPGVWPFHCHIAWHVSGGLQITYMERPDDIAGLNIPQQKWGECNSWSSYSNSTVVDMIDSGL